MAKYKSSRGCDWCRTAKRYREAKVGEHIIVDYNGEAEHAFKTEYGSIVCEVCPECGRKLPKLIRGL